MVQGAAAHHFEDSYAASQGHDHYSQIIPIESGDFATLNMPLQFFSPTEVEILIVLTERMVGTDFPDVGHSPTATTIDAFVAGLPLNLRVQLRRALHLFQWCPILFTGKLRPFTRLSPHDADTYIRSWAESRFGLRRRLFRGLRDLTFLGYYSQSATGIYQTSTDKPERR